jgi:choline/glycine/proline betaine transport protein
MNRTNTPEDHYYRAEVFLSQGGQTYDVYGYDQQEIIGDILDHFEKYLHFLHISPGQLPWNMAEHDEMLHDPGPAVVKDKPAGSDS